MNWDAIGALGELVGGVAVIATLVSLLYKPVIPSAKRGERPSVPTKAP